MLRSVNDLKGFEIVATDGEIGDVEQFYFDDERWALRYIVVNTGNWLAGRQVLVAPFSVMQVDRENSKLHVTLTEIRWRKARTLTPTSQCRVRWKRPMRTTTAITTIGAARSVGGRERPDLAAQQSATTAPAVTEPHHRCDCRDGARHFGRRSFA